MVETGMQSRLSLYCCWPMGWFYLTKMAAIPTEQLVGVPHPFAFEALQDELNLQQQWGH